MPSIYLSDSAYSDLLADLAGAFMAAATGMGDLHGKLAEALAVAGVMPEACREGAEVVVLAA
ncbi:MAG TPA: hypothetical protein VNQ78_07600 [Paracoccus sp. (in: a-proteobacteria)]|uniref:hypothetical protein n=1 Tax=Paracoccus sp. TaxID=267 RepID=UPI002C2309DC|nr:hypothetical protein [Paracoccus sp. (in: a-proteobacteria)]HWL56527.1 hypothetical protein [Paracoccus sp. (in: a-proteobacteria)]